MEIDTNGNPLRSGGGKLPYLQIGNDKFIGYKEIKRVLDLEVSDQCRNPKAKKTNRKSRVNKRIHQAIYIHWRWPNLYIVLIEKLFEINFSLILQGYPVDSHLNTKQKNLSTTYSDWVFTHLHAYYHYFLYGEPNNYDTTTRGLYAKRTPFPFNFYYPSTYQREACDVVQVMGGFDINDKVEKHESDFVSKSRNYCKALLFFTNFRIP